VLADRNANGATEDGFLRVNKHTAKPATAAEQKGEGDMPPVNSIFVTPTTTLADVGIVRFTVHQAKDLETSGVCAADLKAYAKVFLVIVSCITSSSTENGVCDCFVLCVCTSLYFAPSAQE
jgi:hypothetical protein